MMKMKSLVYAAVISVLVMTSLYSQESFHDGEMCTVDVQSTLNLREEPNKRSRSITSLSSGQTLTILENSGVSDSIEGVDSYWYRVATRNGFEGYVFGGFLRKGERFDAGLRMKDAIWGNDEPGRPSIESMLAIEKSQMKQQGNVERQGNYLLMTLSSGRKISFVNPKDGSQRFIYREYNVSIDCHMLYVQYPEGGHGLLVNAKTGVQIKVPNYLYAVSPDNTRIAVLREYSSSGWSSGITIVKINRDAPVVEFQTDDSFSPVNCEWTDNNEIKITAKAGESESSSYSYTFLMKKKGSKWIFEK
jgi:Bacterial SH3 domain